MKTRLFPARQYLLGLLIVLATSFASADEMRKQLILKSFEDYRHAINTQNGEKASELIAYKTLAFFEEARLLALSADREQLFGASFPVRMYALNLRVTQDYEFLQAANGKSVISRLIPQGAISPRALDKIALQSIKHDETLAKITFSIEGKLYPESMTFVFEDGKWRYHLYGFMGFTLNVIEKDWVNAGKDINLDLMDMVETTAGRPVSESIWDDDPTGW